MTQTVKRTRKPYVAIDNFDLVLPQTEKKNASESKSERKGGSYLSQPALLNPQEDEREVVTIRIDGEPVPWARPVPIKRHGKRCAVTAQKQARHKSALMFYIRKAWSGRLMIARDNPASLEVTFSYLQPEKKKAREHKTTRPDLDNLLKQVLDAMQGERMCVKDDAQFNEIIARKIYGQTAYTEITIKYEAHKASK